MPVLVGLALAGCASGPRAPALSALRLQVGQEQVFEIQVTGEALTIGNRGLEHSADKVSGIMGKRVLFRSDHQRDLYRQGLWRLKRAGTELEGVVEGQDARFTVQRKEDSLVIRGHVGMASLAVGYTARALSVAVQDMKHDFILDPGASTAGTQVYFSAKGRLRLRLSTGALKQSRAALDMVLLMFAVELWAENRRIAFRDRPGWLSAPTEYYNGGGR